MRMLDDVYGDDHDRFPLEQEALWRIAALEWDDEVGDDGGQPAIPPATSSRLPLSV